MTNETPTESTSRKAFVTTLVSILLSPISVALGFYLNHVLQKPNIRIQDLEQSYFNESHSLPQPIVAAIKAQPTLAAQIRDVIVRTELAKGDISCVDWLDDKPWQDRCFETVSTAASGVDSVLLAATVARAPKGMESAMPSRAEIQSSRKALADLIAWIATAKSDKSETRTGEHCVSANLINSGDFDGVVLKDATLKFDKGQFEVSAEKYTVVKAHGYEQVEFCTGPVVDAERAALEAWRANVKGRQETSFEILVTTGDGATLSAKAHLWK
jgi:hypothetical protein